MKKYLIVAFCGLFFTMPARAYIDLGLYPFADVCGSEIDEYCTDVVWDVGDCMIANEGMLGNDCGDAVWVWGRDRFGWRDRDDFRMHSERLRAGHNDRPNRRGHIGDRGDFYDERKGGDPREHHYPSRNPASANTTLPP